VVESEERQHEETLAAEQGVRKERERNNRKEKTKESEMMQRVSMACGPESFIHPPVSPDTHEQPAHDHPASLTQNRSKSKTRADGRRSGRKGTKQKAK
jgi:hypothetical protein